MEKVRNVGVMIFVALAVLTAYPLLWPLGLPIPVDPMTRQVYNIVDQLPANSIVLQTYDFVTGQYSDIAPACIATLTHILEKGNKAVIVDFQSGQGALLASKIFEKATQGKTYGVDYVNLGYVPGGESAMVAFGTDIKKTISKDFSGTPIDNLPLMKNVNTVKDFALIMLFSENINIELRQWISSNPKIVGVPNTMGAPTFIPYYTSGQLKGFLQGLRGGAEYEQLLKKPGLGAATMDGLSLAHLLILGLIVVGNVSIVGGIVKNALSKNKEGKP